MRFLAVLLLALAGFLLGSGLAHGKESAPDAARTLLTKQQDLFADLEKIEKAAKDIVELREQRASGKYILNKEELALEKQARMDLHIFMERSRNNTLEVLAIYDRLLGKEAYVDPLRKLFGKALYQTVEVAWDEKDLEEIVDDLIEGYGVKMFIKGDIDIRRTMSLNGEMTLLAILLQIENVFDAKLTLKDGHLWFVRVNVPDAEKAEEEK